MSILSRHTISKIKSKSFTLIIPFVVLHSFAWGTSAEFLLNAQSVRARGMGELTTPLSDIGSSLQNPGQLALALRDEAAFVILPKSISLIAGLPNHIKSKHHHMGLQIGRFKVKENRDSPQYSLSAALSLTSRESGYQLFTTDGASIARVDELSDEYSVLSVAFGRFAKSHLGIGMNLKYVSLSQVTSDIFTEEQTEKRRSAFAIDLGVALQRPIVTSGKVDPTFGSFRLSGLISASILNIGERFDARAQEKPEQRLPSVFRLGGSLISNVAQYKGRELLRIIGAIEMEEPIAEELKRTFRVGAEATILSALSVRTGQYSKQNDEFGSKSTLGFGANMWGVITALGAIVGEGGVTRSLYDKKARINLFADYSRVIGDSNISADRFSIIFTYGNK